MRWSEACTFCAVERSGPAAAVPLPSPYYRASTVNRRKLTCSNRQLAAPAPAAAGTGARAQRTNNSTRPGVLTMSVRVCLLSAVLLLLVGKATARYTSISYYSDEDCEDLRYWVIADGAITGKDACFLRQASLPPAACLDPLPRTGLVQHSLSRTCSPVSLFFLEIRFSNSRFQQLLRNPCCMYLYSLLLYTW